MNQPYSCTQWGNVPEGGAAQIIHDTSSQIWSWFETGGAVPSTVWIDHEMRVYDMMNNAGSWSIGNRIDEMLEACGSLCDDGGSDVYGCTDMDACNYNADATADDGNCYYLAAGDVNEDETLNIQDLITMVNHILGSSTLTDCALEAADMNADGVVSILDLITLVNAILGNARSAQLNGYAEIEYVSSGNDLIIQIESDVDLAGIQLSLMNDTQVDVDLKDNSHIKQNSHFQNGITRYLAYSMFNQPFDGRTTEILIQSAGKLNMNDIQIIVADINGDALNVFHSQGSQNYQSGPHSFEISKLYPNPFNPSTEISFSLPVDGHVQLAAYDVRGKEVDIIFEGAQSVGKHSYTWNATYLPSGVYYIRLQAGAMITSQKALLIK